MVFAASNANQLQQRWKEQFLHRRHMIAQPVEEIVPEINHPSQQDAVWDGAVIIHKNSQGGLSHNHYHQHMPYTWRAGIAREPQVQLEERRAGYSRFVIP